jgi:hypothetical protein
MMEFLQRGYAGRWLNSAHFYRFQAEKAWPHADGTNAGDSTVNGFTWRSRPCAGCANRELDGLGRPNLNDIISANSNTTFTDWYDTLHYHWYGMTDYYFMTGDETIREAMTAVKDWYLNNSTYQGASNGTGNSDSSAFSIIRQIGIGLASSARFGEYLRATGDPDYAGVWAQGETNYTLLLRPDPCVSGYPTGCTAPPVVGGVGKDPTGISRVRGFLPRCSWGAGNLGRRGAGQKSSGQ